MTTLKKQLDENDILINKTKKTLIMAFAMGVIIGANTKKNKKLAEKWLKKYFPEVYEEWYVKGLEAIEEEFSEKITCKNCTKKIKKEEDLKFCSSCGDKLL